MNYSMMAKILLQLLLLFTFTELCLARLHNRDLTARQIANNESFYYNLSNIETAFQNRINATHATSPVTLNITTQSGTRNKTSPLLYGWMFEDINVQVSTQVIRRLRETDLCFL